MTSQARLQCAHQPMPGIQRVRFSTEDLPEHDRAAAWREVRGRNVVRLDLEPLSKRPLSSDVSVYALPGMAMIRGEISDHRIARTCEFIVHGNSDFRLTPAGQPRAHDPAWLRLKKMALVRIAN
jgi:hypothetical protein